jgi:hypothetical protein
MKPRHYILSKQIQWAINNGIDLMGSKGNRGLPAYTPTLKVNLFEPLAIETIQSISAGDGGELTGNPCKMQAVHSSSALGVNIFQYWQSISQPEKVAHACGLCRATTKISQAIRFEVKYPVESSFVKAPNIDVVIVNDPSAKYKVDAIECKFTEAYGGRKQSGLKAKYLDLDIWGEIPHLHKLAISISPDDNETAYFHRAQLIKHILGLKKAFGKGNFRLLYLWYDTLGYEGWKRRVETEKFIEVAKSDGILVHGVCYQELIVWMAENYRASHKIYVEYITDRYL